MRDMDAIKERVEAIQPGVWTRCTINTWRNHAPQDMRRLIARVERLEACLMQIELWTRNPRAYVPSTYTIHHIALDALAEENEE